MKLTVFNGSPRGKSSNTKILLEQFLNGFMTTNGNTYELAYLNRVNESDNLIRLFHEAEQVLLAFPLYTDAMPAIVKNFIESLEPHCNKGINHKIGFTVQSGFPELIHSQYVERYLEKLAVRLGCTYMGTIIKGGVEGIRIPALQDKKFLKLFCKFVISTNFAGVGKLLNLKQLCESFYELGRNFGETGELNKEILQKLTNPERLTKFGFWAFRLVAQNLYWNLMLKKNNAFEKRFDKPYIR